MDDGHRSGDGVISTSRIGVGKALVNLQRTIFYRSGHDIIRKVADGWTETTAKVSNARSVRPMMGVRLRSGAPTLTPTIKIAESGSKLGTECGAGTGTEFLFS